MTVHLTEFLLARIAEDEAVAQGAVDPDRPGTHWEWIDAEDDTPAVPDLFGEFLDGRASLRTVEMFPCKNISGDLPGFALNSDEVSVGSARHIARHDPARVLAECESKRLLIKRAESLAEYVDATREDGTHTYERTLTRLLAPLALPYADHPDFDQSWAV